MSEQWQDPRVGVLTPEQEQVADELWKNKGVMEALDGLGIKLADNKGIEAGKEALIKKIGIEKAKEVLTWLYQVIDAIFIVLTHHQE